METGGAQCKMGISKKRDIEYRHQVLEERVPIIMRWIGRRHAAKSLLKHSK